jgi:hypothetical protein
MLMKWKFKICIEFQGPRFTFLFFSSNRLSRVADNYHPPNRKTSKLLADVRFFVGVGGFVDE